VTAPAPAAPAPASPTAAPAQATAPGAEELPPASGQLETHSPVRLYGQLAAGNHTGLLSLTLADGAVSIHFRKGNPEFIDSSHPEDALGAWLLQAKLVTSEQLQQAEAARGRFGGELLGALFGLGLLQPASAFTQLAHRAQSILLKGLRAESGAFTFEARELPAAKAMPLGNKWAVLSDLVRRIPSADLRRRLQPVLNLPVMKANGRVPTGDLRLTPHEVRVLALIDGARSVGQLLTDIPQDAEHLLRLVFLLQELDGVSFAAQRPGSPQAAAPRPAPAPAAAQPAAPQAARPASPPPAAPAPAPQAAAPRPATPAGAAPSGPAPQAAAKPATTAPGSPTAKPATTGAAIPVAKPATSATNIPVAKPATTATGTPTAKPATTATGTPTAKPATTATDIPVAKPATTATGTPTAKPATTATNIPVAKPAAPAAAPAPAAPAANDIPALRELAAQLKDQNHFERLGLGADTPGPAVKLAYFKLAKLYHPDTLPPGAPPELEKLKADIFGYIGDAYRTLSDDKSRAAYIEELKSGGSQQESQVDVEAILKSEELFRKSGHYIKARKFADAVKLLDEAIQLNPEEPEFFAWRGYARFFTFEDKKTGYTEAYRDLQHCLKKNEKVASAHYFLGVIAKLCGDNSGALKHFQRTVEIQPNHIDAQREIRMATQKK
jgi:curved DNA-binding protein CbpA